MNKTTGLLRIVGSIQIVLGCFYLFAPDFMLASMGHSHVAQDIHYPLAMLASRFLVYGVIFWFIAAQASQHRLWLFGMIFIQLIDLSAGLFYTATGEVSIEISGFPMFNATWIALLLYFWMPKPLIQKS